MKEDDNLLNAAFLKGSSRFEGEKVTALGLNHRFRFLRYDPGDYLRPHRDGSFAKDDDISFVTLQLYLSESFVGGETRFLPLGSDSNNLKEGQYFDVVPRIGTILLFQHDLGHEGRELVEGRKYAVRTDIMYRPVEDK